MPLDRVDVERELENRRAGVEIDLSQADLDGTDLSGLEFENVRFVAPDTTRMLVGTSFAGATLRNCVLTGVTFEGVSLREATLDRVQLRRATFEDCDMRRISITHTGFGEAALRRCDLYRAQLGNGTMLDVRELHDVSFGKAALAGAVGLRRVHFEAREAVVQEVSDARYREFLRTLPEPLDKRAEDAAVANRLHEASEFYRALSALWASSGAYGDSGWAYARSRSLERRHASPRRGGTPGSWVRWLGLWVAGLVSGFGLSPRRVLASAFALGAIPGVIYALAGGVKDGGDTTHRLTDGLLFSFGQLTSSAPARLGPATELVEWLSLGQVMLGVTLLGLLGFVLGNVIRSG